MGSCFSCETVPHYPRITYETLDFRTESTFCAVYNGHGPVPSGQKVETKTLGMQTNFDCYCRGTTTALTLLKQDEDVVIAQIGNSGAVLGTRDENNKLIPVCLTVMGYKPHHLPAAATIRKCRGRRIFVEPEPQNHKDTPYLTPTPLISHRRIADEDEFVVLATAGVWDVLSNEDVVTIVATCPTRSDAAQAVVGAAIRAWMNKYPTSQVDDCAVACLFLNSTTNSTPHPLAQLTQH
ncbi:probable protein phosphatase 2C 33 isoform X1 [Salvia splendens]|uniref:probable protein phosphatase 2C 33 isoform X1 n=1 Tax=Salvia splendens TaxID=180675 RepID=UPI001C25E92D|nr:probable protein phosphatase 2C 33 isoform X1 [Salvia splendens]